MRAEHNHWAGLVVSDRAAIARKRGRPPLEHDEIKRVISVSLTKTQYKELHAITKNKSGFIRDLLDHELHRLKGL